MPFSFFYLVALPAVACATCWGLLFLPSRSTGWLVRLDVGLAWFASLATLILVPADVAAALAGSPTGHLAAWWQASYWYGFAAMVLVLPLHMEFIRSGEFTVRDRLAAAARYNLLYYGALLAAGLAGIVLLLVSGRLHVANIAGLAIACSNAYGLIAAIFLLGFGLVAVPRELWYTADPHGEQRRVCHKAGLQAERAQAAHRRLSAAAQTARRASVLFAAHDPLRPQMDVVLALADSAGPGLVLDEGVPVPDEAELDVFDRSDLAALRAKVKAALQDWEREQAIYAEVVTHHLHLQAVVEQIDAGLPEGTPMRARLAWLWQCHLHFWAYRALAAAAALCSLAIVVAEATVASALPNLSVVSAALHGAAGSQFWLELLCFLFLAYPCACAYYSLYRLGRFAFYRMVPRHTDAYSLCTSALLMSRFAAPLAFNFIAAIALPVSSASSAPPPGAAAPPDVTRTVFYQQIGHLMMDQPLIGWSFNTWAPALLVPYMLLLASGVFGHIVGLFKRGDALEFEDDWLEDSYTATGRRLLRAESDNARQGLPPGLTVDAAAAASRGSSSGGAVPAARAASAGLLGTMRGAAAAAAAEEAAERRQGGWLGRLVPGAGGSSGGGSRDSQAWRLVEAGRDRLRGLVGGDRGAAGYSALSSAPVPTASQLPREGGGADAGGSSDIFGSLGTSPARPAAGGMKAARAKYLARGTAGSGSGAGLAGAPGGGSVDVESGG